MAVHEKATHQQTRTHNRQLVLRTIFDHGVISRADVARSTHLTPVTVSELVAELIADNLVREIAQTDREDVGDAKPAKRGRRPILLEVAADQHQIVALRLAVHEFRGALLDLNGEFVFSKTVPVGAARDAQAVDRLTELVDELVERARKPILGIGVASPGIVDTVNGIVLRSVFFGWRHLPLGEILRQRYRMVVHVANASQVTALAEHLFGSKRSLSNLAVVRVGQDVGAGFVIDGQLFFGDGFGAGEIGHIVVDEGGDLCACGNRGCLETKVSTVAVLRQARALASAHPLSPLAQAIAGAEGQSLNPVLAALAVGDPLAAQIVRENASYVGRALATIVGLLNIQHIRLVGSITQFGDCWLEELRSTLLENAIPDTAQQTEIEIAEHGPNAVILGAAALLLSRELGLTLARRAGSWESRDKRNSNLSFD
ncbi:MAG: sugar kinase [Chloroflexota bacterium]|nr:MAG: sugar kinase [Chloroflexota bacterium]